MKIENENLEINSIEMKVQEQKVFLEVKGGSSNQVFVFPIQLKNLISFLLNVQNIKQLIISLYTSGQNFSFHRIFKILELFCTYRIIKNENIIEYIDNLRTKYYWRNSILNSPISEFTLFSLNKKKPNFLVAFIVSLFIFPFLSFTTYYAIKFISTLSIADLNFNFLQNNNYWPVIIILYIYFSFTRTIRTLFKVLLLRNLSGRKMKIRFAFNFLSTFMNSSNVHLIGLNFFLAGFILISSFLTLLSPLGLMFYAGVSYNWQIIVLFLVFLQFLVDYSPFVSSELTEKLKFLYNYWDEKYKNKSSNLEIRIISVHIFSKIFWLSFFSFFFIFLLKFIFKDLYYAVMYSPVLKYQISAIVFSFIFLIILFSFVDDIINFMLYGSDVNRSLIRNHWIKEKKSSNEQISNLKVERLGSGSQFLTKQLVNSLRDEQFINSLPFLRNIEPNVREKILKNSSIVFVNKGLRICRQGNYGRDMFIVLLGEIGVYKRNFNNKNEFITKLENGAIFGELGFFLDKPRNADIISLSDSAILKIHYDPLTFKEHLSQNLSEVLQTRIRFLQALVSSNLFKDLPGEAMDSILFLGNLKNVNAGYVFIKQGDVGDSCYFVIEGSANVFKDDKLINQMDRGDLFGEIALLLKSCTRTASIIAKTNMIVIEIKRKDFWNLLSENLSLALQIEKIAFNRLRNQI